MRGHKHLMRKKPHIAEAIWWGKPQVASWSLQWYVKKNRAGLETQCLPGLKRHWNLITHRDHTVFIPSSTSYLLCQKQWSKGLNHKYLTSASITHRETEGKFTEAYSTSKYTPSGLKLYSTRENGDKPNVCFHIQQAGVRRRFAHLRRCQNT